MAFITFFYKRPTYPETQNLQSAVIKGLVFFDSNLVSFVNEIVKASLLSRYYLWHPISEDQANFYI